MQLSQLTLEPHIHVILVEYKLCTHTCLFFPSVLLVDIFDYCSVPGNVEDYVSGFNDF
jgi:hypothetical protein